MPFFKSTPPPPPPPAPEPVVVEEKRGLFGRKKTVVRNGNDKRSSIVSPTATSPTTETHNKLVSPTSPTAHNYVSRLDEINTVLPAAREKVRLAEVAENNARAALKQAETAVIEARRHVAALEQEAKEQARLAELASRQAQAKLNEFDSLKKKTDRMGRI